ncbi:uncharacterized protein CLUP02_05286 [Colletotrichum lupini]|uniref:Uncharacterized protein n=1 Tax=Colletotrichum lupini TaxID=145971 RepID=A0A9Q8WE35_9PEZI|nr:uncharacterized protein CLUP02_05286 [Colletotrichum lupini]UQC79806.1 hypothetical protein CLUP02_05286 [Colletotrichum lupini]
MTRNEAGSRFSSLTSTSTDSTRSSATVRPSSNPIPASRKSSMRLKTEGNGAGAGTGIGNSNGSLADNLIRTLIVPRTFPASLCPALQPALPHPSPSVPPVPHRLLLLRPGPRQALSSSLQWWSYLLFSIPSSPAQL